MPDPLIEVSRRLDEVLGRQRISVDLGASGAHLRGRRVLITGAGGSIGTALSETLASAGTASLTLLDAHENSLFRLRQQLQARHPVAPARFVLADVRDGRRIGQVLDQERPEVIFHLAAYKHVPLAEELPEEFAAVNVLGTWRLANEAVRAGVSTIVYPSTDKAVNPPSVYGATKRCSERVLQSIAASRDAARINAVRLVNVLGAWGGVIETFTRQITSGQAVTITDPRMTRYWITMDEALHLLLGASVCAGTGKIMLLDLGDPIRVETVAERLWAMLGSPDHPMPVQYCGSRPGERLEEHLRYPEEQLARSDCPHLVQVQSPARPLPLPAVAGWIGNLEAAVQRGAREDVRRILFDFALPKDGG